MIVDLSNLQNSLAINTAGESGHAGNDHYVDMTNLWRMIQYHPMLWDPTEIQSSAAEVLYFIP